MCVQVIYEAVSGGTCKAVGEAGEGRGEGLSKCEVQPRSDPMGSSEAEVALQSLSYLETKGFCTCQPLACSCPVGT